MRMEGELTGEVDVWPCDAVSKFLTDSSSQNFADGKVRPDIEDLLTDDNASTLDPGGKPGGGGKADGDGAVDIDDLTWEITRERRLSSGLECEFAELKKPGAGDRYDDDECALSSSAGTREASYGDGRGGKSCGESWKGAPVPCSSWK